MGTMDWRMQGGILSDASQKIEDFKDVTEFHGEHGEIVAKTVRSERGDGVFYEVLNEQLQNQEISEPNWVIAKTELSVPASTLAIPEKVKKKQKFFWLALFVLGLAAGTLFVNFAAADRLSQSGAWMEAALSKMTGYEVNVGFFLHILIKRVGFFTFLALITLLCRRNLVLYLSTAYFGFCFGVVISSVTAVYGFQGLLQLLELLMPHYLMYIPAYILLLRWAQGQKKEHIRNRKKSTISPFFLSGLVLWTVMLVAGCVMECYLNPLWIRFFQQLELF